MVCEECQHPPCEACGAKIMEPQNPRATERRNRHYYCDDCRCPLRRSCGINRKPTLRSNTSFDENFICDECKVKEQESDAK
eukprot:6584230-Karenia_brevis.AAC.1